MSAAYLGSLTLPLDSLSTTMGPIKTI